MRRAFAFGGVVAFALLAIFASAQRLLSYENYYDQWRPPGDPMQRYKSYAEQFEQYARSGFGLNPPPANITKSGVRIGEEANSLWVVCSNCGRG